MSEAHRLDYAVLMKDILIRLRDSVGGNAHATNLADTALDYLFYLEDRHARQDEENETEGN